LLQHEKFLIGAGLEAKLEGLFRVSFNMACISVCSTPLCFFAGLLGSAHFAWLVMLVKYVLVLEMTRRLATTIQDICLEVGLGREELTALFQRIAAPLDCTCCSWEVDAFAFGMFEFVSGMFEFVDPDMDAVNAGQAWSLSDCAAQHFEAWLTSLFPPWFFAATLPAPLRLVFTSLCRYGLPLLITLVFVWYSAHQLYQCHHWLGRARMALRELSRPGATEEKWNWNWRDAVFIRALGYKRYKNI
jgi:hypothetical protein